jgi:hypothetical protein
MQLSQILTKKYKTIKMSKTDNPHFHYGFEDCFYNNILKQC